MTTCVYVLFLLALVLSIIFTLLIRQVALKFGFVDRPDGDRKIHQKPVALLGGTAIFILSFSGRIFYYTGTRFMT